MDNERWMRRCFDLARLGAGHVSPNPMVGAVLVHKGRVIGEGWHQKYGEAHAEVNCIGSVSPVDQPLISSSTLFCSLEPCFHFGKTPPCVDLILEKNIPRVVVSNTDPNPKVAGQSLEKLKTAGIEIELGFLEAEGRWVNRAFFSWITKRRPHIILKWAQTSDGFIGQTGERIPISGPAALRLVHRWRSEVDAILVGATTARTDNPRLDTRLYSGRNPLRVVFDRQGVLPKDFHLLDDSTETWVFGPPRTGRFQRTTFFPIKANVLIANILDKIRETNRATLLVEGGAIVLHQFLANGCWDEIRVVENDRRLSRGLAAPEVPASAILQEQIKIGEDMVRVYCSESFFTEPDPLTLAST